MGVDPSSDRAKTNEERRNKHLGLFNNHYILVRSQQYLSKISIRFIRSCTFCAICHSQHATEQRMPYEGEREDEVSGLICLMRSTSNVSAPRPDSPATSGKTKCIVSISPPSSDGLMFSVSCADLSSWSPPAKRAQPRPHRLDRLH